MVLVVTNRDDLTADWLLIELRDRGADTARFNTEDYPHATSLRWAPDEPGVLALPDGELVLGNIDAVWFRRPVLPRAPDDVDDDLAAWAVREAQEALDGVWRTLDVRWVNHPDANALADCKPEQLSRAIRAGFEIPPTVVTNDPDTLRVFAELHGPRLVCKPLYEGWVPSPTGDRVFWTSELNASEADTFGDLAGEPYLFQAVIPKRYDVRVTVIGDEAFAVAIESQGDDESALDWRRGSVEELKHRVEELPEALSRRCVDLVADYGLSFGALDFARRLDGGYTFFELNPNGQWVWLEQRTGLPLRERLADLLLESRR